jgi:hypothetical protein
MSGTVGLYPRGIAINGGLVIPDCIIEESGRDDLQITEHPVEFGTTISDHAYKKPREVTLRWSWSNSDPAHPSDAFVLDIYNTLLAIQAARQPFTLYTGKSSYDNMLIASVGQTTNSAAEYSLNTVIVCREVIITYTAAAPPPKSSQASPQNTTATKKSGSKQPIQKGTGFGKAISDTTIFNVPGPALG